MNKRILFITSLIIVIGISLGIYYNKPPNHFIISDGKIDIKIDLEKNTDTSFTIVSSEKEHLISKWKLDYPVFHFECAEINNDGTEDILVGVIKTTRFDPIKRKRIFIFKLMDGYIRPLWLGSRVSTPLEDFKVVQDNSVNYIRTIQLEKNGNFLVADYEWKAFGINFVRYIKRNISLNEAQQILNNN